MSVSTANIFTPITHFQERTDKGKTKHVHVQGFLSAREAAEHKQIYSMYITYV